MGATHKPHLATLEFAGFKPTVYGSQPFSLAPGSSAGVSGIEAVVRSPAVYRCNSESFSYAYIENMS
jgi:hypothetical protein